jgi:Gpi18-like mannosyltransferase
MTSINSPRAESPFFRGAFFYPLCAALALSAIGLRWLCLPFLTHDMQDFLLPWFDYIVTHGRFAALSDAFYNYTPPYIYLMMAASYLDGLVDRVVLIKSISFAFDLVAAVLVYRIGVAVTGERRRSALFALLFLNLPTVILNGAMWGQCDIIFTSFLLAFAYCLIRGRPVSAMLMYGIALSIKVQAILLAPFVGYLILAGIVPRMTIVLPPLIYGLMALPAALAGRGWLGLLTIYADQAGIANKLSARAPNIYVVIQHFLPPAYYPQATIAGEVAAGLITLLLFWTHFGRKRLLEPGFILAACLMWLAVEPSILPKMHDRYFFAADILSFVFLILRPRAWWIAALFQVASALAYSYFMAIDHDVPFDLHPAALIGALAAMPATLGALYYYWRAIGAPRRIAPPLPFLGRRRDAPSH